VCSVRTHSSLALEVRTEASVVIIVKDCGRAQSGRDHSHERFLGHTDQK